MKKGWIWMIAILAVFAVRTAPAPARAEAAENEGTAEWTVMFYLCGSDLESGHGYATENLKEIMTCKSYAKIWSMTHGEAGDETPDPSPEGVNIVMETGGSKKWHTEDFDIEIATDRLQRWHYKLTEARSSSAWNTLEPEGDLPLASMADPETLADFIRWSAERYPAKKYALVLWDHGGGSKAGIFIDELFDGDTMYLDELRTALTESGVQLEAVLFDACLMANIETAYAIKDGARWMIASEEVVAGEGTAMGNWLQQLYMTPQWDGERLGRWICDMTQGKYANIDDLQSRATMTWSVTDLRQIDRLAACFDRFFETIGQTYAGKPLEMMNDADALSSAFRFGIGDEQMIDLMGILYNPYIGVKLDKELYNEMLDSITRAVVYSKNGPDRAGANGLSFCFAASFSAKELDIYARNCPSAHYLAFLDAIHPGWEAPEWVYETAERLPEITEISDYQIEIRKIINAENVPGVVVKQGYTNISYVHADLCRVNPETGNTVRLGSTTTRVDLDEEERLRYAFSGFRGWPAIEGVHCDAELVRTEYIGRALYNIPVRLGTEKYLLRCGFEEQAQDPMVIYGLWEGYDADSTVFNRNVISLSKVAGQEYCLLYPIDDPGASGRTAYETSKSMTIFRMLEIEPKRLPAGTYYLDYWVEDIFTRRLPIGRAEVIWDGEKCSTPAGTWQGEAEISPIG